MRKSRNGPDAPLLGGDLLMVTIEPEKDVGDIISIGTTDRLRQRSLAGQPVAVQRGPQAVAG